MKIKLALIGLVAATVMVAGCSSTTVKTDVHTQGYGTSSVNHNSFESRQSLFNYRCVAVNDLISTNAAGAICDKSSMTNKYVDIPIAGALLRGINNLFGGGPRPPQPCAPTYLAPTYYGADAISQCPPPPTWPGATPCQPTPGAPCQH